MRKLEPFLHSNDPAYMRTMACIYSLALKLVLDLQRAEWRETPPPLGHRSAQRGVQLNLLCRSRKPWRQHVFCFIMPPGSKGLGMGGSKGLGMGSKGLGMGGRQTTLFANFARAPPEGGAAPPRVAPPAAPKQAKLGFSASSGTRPGTGLFETASRPEKKKTFKQGRLGQPSGAAAARPSSEDCIMVDDAPHGPSSHKASSSHNHGNGNGNVRQGGGLLADQERKRKQVLSLPPPPRPIDQTSAGVGGP